ncbi:FMN-binding glutamate synthase family protein [Neisseria sp. Ec49-e6-T10]|uniref:FMN-binding glutamate synthase family protein n=1 Tax=Neisseria sp. Ec49-e6-T10 TaxID=3140744 RepID=UPI003EB709B1
MMKINRYSFFIACLILTILSLCLTPFFNWIWALFTIFGLLSLIGIYDVIQQRHAVLRNYPILGHMRYLIENIRPEIRQYLVEAENEALPFSRAQRSLVYRRAKNLTADQPFGTLLDTDKQGFEFIGHSMTPKPAQPISSYRISIGNEQCQKPYSASLFNISAMSFGSLSANAIKALNKGAKMGNFAHDTGEGSISMHHEEYGGDLIWEIASGYFGCRAADGTFDATKYAQTAAHEQIKMIEVKLSQGAKPGHGGILPKEKITQEIAITRGIPMGEDCISPPSHSAFSNPMEFMAFLSQLRELSNGKPVGFKLCIGYPWEFMSIVKAMLKTGFIPDFIVVDGTEGGTGAAPLEFSDHIGMPMREGLLFVHNTLVGAGIRDKIKIGAAGKIISAYDIISTMAIGADWINSARGFMMAVGCIQSQSCHTNKCPTGVATQDPQRQKALVVPDKAERVFNFHKNTLKALSEMVAAAGLEHPAQITAHHVSRRFADGRIQPLSSLYTFIEENALINGSVQDPFYQKMWAAASPESFNADVSVVY